MSVKFKSELCRHTVYVGAGILALGMQSLVPAIAQTDDDADDTGDQIIVTAQKREQSLLEVPSGLTVFDEELIQFNRIEDLEDFAIRSPNVKFNSSGNASRSNVSIRGVSRLGGNFNSIGIYLDEFNIAPFSGNGAINPILFEVEQIEVLRGPQGVFFGRNSTAGAINVTTRKPTTDEFHGQLTAEFGSFGTASGRGYFNIPVNDTLATSVSLFYRHTDGFIDDSGPASSGNDVDEFGSRLAGRWTPTDRLTVDLWGAYSLREGGSGNRIPSGDITPPSALQFALTNEITQNPFVGFLGLPTDLPVLPDFQGLGVFPDNNDSVAFDAVSSFENENITIVGKAQYDLGGVDFIITGGYTDNDYSETLDADFTATPIFVGNFNLDLSSWNIEARFASNESIEFGGFNIDWSLGGGYYENSQSLNNPFFSTVDGPFNGILFAEEGDIFPGTMGDPMDPPSPAGPLADLIPGQEVSNPFGDTDSESFAFFFNTTIAYGDWIELQGGGRFSRDEISETGGDSIPTDMGQVDNIGSASDTFSDFSPRVSLSLFPTDGVTLYGLASRGYRAGGFDFVNTMNPIGMTPGGIIFGSETVTFSEETVWNYEIGAKASLFDNRLQVNAAGFILDWDDLQVLQFDFTTNQTFTQNATAASSIGAEIDFIAKPTERITLSGGAGYVDAEFDDFPNAVDATALIDPTDPTSNIVDVTGGPIPNTSEWTANVAGRYDHPIKGGALLGYASLEYIYQGGFNTLVVPSPQFDVDEYDLLNLRIGVEDENWDIMFFIDNVLGEEFSTGNFFAATSFVGVLQTVGAPRTLGLKFSADF